MIARVALAIALATGLFAAPSPPRPSKRERCIESAVTHARMRTADSIHLSRLLASAAKAQRRGR